MHRLDQFKFPAVQRLVDGDALDRYAVCLAGAGVAPVPPKLANDAETIWASLELSHAAKSTSRR
jgi:hypothetical protein